MNRETALFLASVAALYHLAALVRDADAVEANLVRYRHRPSVPNLRRLLLAEGALIGDLGWLFG